MLLSTRIRVSLKELYAVKRLEHDSQPFWVSERREDGREV